MTKNFILVDDDPIFNFLTGHTVENSSCSGKIYSFTEAIEALNYIQGLGESYDNKTIVFLDVRMPVISGLDFLELFHKKISKQKQEVFDIYMLTSSLNSEDKEIALSFDCVKDFLSKPLEFAQMEKICGE